MAGALNIKVEGLQELLARLQKAPVEIQENIAAVLDDSMKAMQAEAKVLAPVKLSILVNAIHILPPINNGLTVGMESKANYSAYVEWGTGTKVSIAGDEDERNYEETFKSGREIPGMYARPFFFPAVRHQIPIMLEEIKKKLAKI